ncbi:MAG: DeoR/GlpR family DNA-binding transcription regulator [Pelagimonas sp.]|jgi:DeoR/GlpR family transcriptional regulator of sugar metabolism|nr:DeoR/GlpR family DNA-binding transcription regulator [Pelagimonas sp.]
MEDGLEHQENDLMSLIRASQEGLTPKMLAIAELCLSDTERFIRNTSKEICVELNTSEPTLIRFCRQFGHNGLSDFRIDLALSLAKQPRPHGFVEPLAGDRRQVNLQAKHAIAQRAAHLIGETDTLLIDNGSTAEFFASCVPAQPKRTIMTNGLVVAQNALAVGSHDVMLTGGRIRPNALSLTGRMVEGALGTMRFDTFVMGADAIDPRGGCSTYREDEAHITRAMMGAAARTIVLADHTKFKKPALHRICGFDAVDTLVSDLAPDDPAVEILAEQGVEVVLVQPQSA